MRNVAYSCDLISQDLLLLLLPLLLSLSLSMRVCLWLCACFVLFRCGGGCQMQRKSKIYVSIIFFCFIKNLFFSFFLILTLPFVFLFLHWFKVIYRWFFWFFNGDFSPRHFSPLFVVGTEDLTALNDSVTVGFHQSEVKIKWKLKSRGKGKRMIQSSNR